MSTIIDNVELSTKSNESSKSSKISNSVKDIKKRVAKTTTLKVTWRQKFETQPDGSRKIVFLDSDPEEDWVEVFIDLIYVACLIQLGKALSYCGYTFENIIGAVSCLILLLSCRMGMDEFANRFAPKNILFRFIYLCYTIAVSVISLNISLLTLSGDGDMCIHENVKPISYLGFITGLFVCRGIIFGLNFITVYQYPELYLQLKRKFIYFAGSLILIVAYYITLAAYYSDDNGPKIFKYFLLGILCYEYIASSLGDIAYLLYRYYFNDKSKLVYIVPINLTIVQGRMGAIILIMLGEGVIQLLSTLPNLHYASDVYAYLIGGVGIAFTLAMDYFEFVTKHDLTHHAARENMIRGAIWIHLHMLLNVCCFFVGLGLKESYHGVESHGHIEHHEGPILLAIAVGLSSVIMLIQRFLHHWPQTDELFYQRLKGFFIRLCVISLHFWALLFPHSLTSKSWFIYYHLLVCGIKNIYDSNLHHKQNKLAHASHDHVKLASEESDDKDDNEHENEDNQIEDYKV